MSQSDRMSSEAVFRIRLDVECTILYRSLPGSHGYEMSVTYVKDDDKAASEPTHTELSALNALLEPESLPKALDKASVNGVANGVSFSVTSPPFVLDKRLAERASLPTEPPMGFDVAGPMSACDPAEAKVYREALALEAYTQLTTSDYFKEVSARSRA